MSPDCIPPNYERLDPEAVPYDREVRLIRVGVLTVLFGGLAATAFADGWLSPTLRVVLACLAGLLVLLDLTLAFVMPRLRHRYTAYRVDEKGLEIRRGVLWRSITTVARSRIQHLDVTQGPLERRHGLGRLQIHTAGTHDATVELHGLAHEQARALRDDLGAWGADDDGV